MLLRERIEALEAALNRDVEVDLGPDNHRNHLNDHTEDKVRHSTDERHSSWPVYASAGGEVSSSASKGSRLKSSMSIRRKKKNPEPVVVKKQEIAIVPSPTPIPTTTTAILTPTLTPTPPATGTASPTIASNNPYHAANYEKQISLISDNSNDAELELSEKDEHPTMLPNGCSIAETLGLSHLRAEDSIEYNVYNAFVTNLRVCPVDLQGTYYYVEHRSFVPQTPGAILREGTDKDGRCVGVANLPYIGINTLGLGDFKNAPHDMRWERMAKGAFWTHTKYEFEFGPVEKRRRFWWIRTTTMVLDDQGDLVLVEHGNESEVLAEYTGKGVLKWKKRGALRIRNAENEFGEGWLQMVLLTWAAVVELARRRARQRRLSALHLL